MDGSGPFNRLPLWGGVECTVNRVGDRYHDQLRRNGHRDRSIDLDRFADLGITALRYPVLWEHTAMDGLVHANWSSADRGLSRLRELGLTPVVGLVHHGSGPPETNLLDPGFITGLSDYAGAVAERYPWIETYTPINEPLTTARFSGLYGIWYPHACSDEAFASALLIQSLAIAESMRRIRTVNPAAKLLLTEDLAKIHSTQRLASQARFENLRRWLSIDLLMGRVDRRHAMWSYLSRNSQLEEFLNRLLDDPMPPDLLGFNYYLTSERMLDERLDRYPSCTHGGNGFHQYADVEAVRVREQGIDGIARLLKEAWGRYHLPMAITEVHLGGDCTHQIRWVLDTYRDATALRAEGVDIRAMTIWSLLGCFDWNTLCTSTHGHYESGVFDIRSGDPVGTELAQVVRRLARGIEVNDHEYPELGWWRTDQRFAYEPVCSNLDSGEPDSGMPGPDDASDQVTEEAIDVAGCG